MSGTGTDTADEEQIPSEDILDIQIERGLSELRRPVTGLSLSALSAGLDIGFGPLLMAVVLTSAGVSGTGDLPKELLLGLAYGVGFILVVLGRSELFTEHTTLAVLPVLDDQAGVARLGRLWGTVYASNIVGAVLFAWFAVAIGPAVGVVEPATFVELAKTYTEQSPAVLVGAGIMAGWLMGLLSWLVAAADSTVSRMLIVWLIAASIGFAHLPHCIAGSVEVVAGVIVAPEMTVLDYGRFLVFSTVGNTIGGVVFVALLKYGHVVRSGPSHTEVHRK
ncbi:MULTISPECIES: formate/nitrite transporter family protein [Haloarcula]|uniref:Formate dehydrogenase n=1 Tax=Haloarcula pellucida TaxID=1427151 RepID=A0A830GJX3_9EURY|nr:MULTISPECIES: formate/nitrite transporter family protein [Halomicroarcula]MBX0347519.1 formate/nitrite transporter family protein [Halomicroarcula pellucida]MDS0276607.1 formate/nitrite transporter family protein [Halomicroarcula sp. S1AR25-4]GGN89062.1 formate dehydrogenase [Halomicroarcula pellucida]